MRKTILTAILLLATTPALATLCTVTEFAILGIDDNGNQVQLPNHSAPENIDDVSFTTSSTQSDVFGANTRLVMIVCDGAARYTISASPTADNTDEMWIPANIVMYLNVDPGHRIAFIDKT